MQINTINLDVQFIPDYFKDRIKIPPGQREGKIWTMDQKQWLIDSLYNNFDIPKIYFRVDSKNPKIWYLVDGQQRLEAIKEFLEDKFPLSSENLPEEVRGKYYSALKPEDKAKIVIKSLTAILYQIDDESEEEDLFLRLNNGTPLNAAEKRNAIRGAFRDSVKKLAGNSFFKKTQFASKRYSYDGVCAQLSAVVLSGGPTSLKGTDLKKIYEEKKIYKDKQRVEKEVRSILSLMSEVFPEREPFLKKFNVITIFSVLNHLKRNYTLNSLLPRQILSFLIKFENLKRENSQKTEEDQRFKPELFDFYEKSVNSPDSKDAVETRHRILLDYILREFPNLQLKDTHRLFSEEQKLTIYYLAKGKCMGVGGFACPNKDTKIPREEGEFDHKDMHSDGGKTTVSNGQFLCKECHLYKTTHTKNLTS